VPPTGNKGIHPHASGRSSDPSTQLGLLSHLGSYCSRETTTLSSVIMSKNCVLVLVSYGEFVSLVMASILIVLILATALEECMGIGARHHMYSYLSVFNVCLKSRRQFVQSCCCSEIRTSSINWVQLSRFHLKTKTETML
jgi:hypothetical protein